jgi:hypothetical protein
MKKILAALVLAALVFGGAAAQEFAIEGEVAVEADLFSVTSTAYSDNESVTGSSDAVPPEARWAIVDATSINFADTTIKFSVTADNYGGIFQFGAPDAKGLDKVAGSSAASYFRQVELWVQPASFLKLWFANGDSPWRGVERYKDDVDSFDIAYGPKGYALTNNGQIDEFKNGLKADIIIGEAATIEALVGVNQPLWEILASEGKVPFTGKFSDAIALGGVPITLGTPASDTLDPAYDVWADTAVAAAVSAGIISKETHYVLRYEDSGGNWNPVAADTAIFMPFDLNIAGNKKLSLFGRYAPNYGIRINIPVADIGKFTAMYRLGIQDKVDVLDVTKADPEFEGYSTITSNFGIYADLKPLFESRDLPLGVVVGYSGYFVSGEKVDDVKNFGKKIDATPVYVSGIDLRAAYTANEQLSLAFHANATLFTLAYDKDFGFGKYYNVSSPGFAYAGAAEKDYTDFNLFLALGATYALSDAFKVNLELADDLHTMGYYVKGAKDQGDGIYDNTFQGKLMAILTVGEKATLKGGLGLDINAATSLSQKGTEAADGKAAVTTTTKFYIPVGLSVKFGNN